MILLRIEKGVTLKRHGLYIAQKYGVSLHDTWSIGYTARFDIQAPTYHVQSEKLESRIGSQYDQIEVIECGVGPELLKINAPSDG